MSGKYKTKFTYLEPTFICTSCNKERPHEYRETGRNRCSVCSGHRAHIRKGRKLTYAEFESNYIRNKELGVGVKNKCNVCLRIQEPSAFKSRHGKICNDCWYADAQIIIRRCRKIIRVPIRNSARGLVLFERTFGYSFKDFKKHIENLFTNGMTWDKVINKEIHIDHIIPAAAFDQGNVDHFNICWSLANLQPLWAKDNQEKHDKLINGMRVQDIKKKDNHRTVLNHLLFTLYNVNLS